MAKKQKAKDKADIKDESIDSQETLEEDDLLEEETDGSDEETVANQNADEKIKDLEEALLRSRAELDNAFKRNTCLLYTSPSPRDAHESRMPSSA